MSSHTEVLSPTEAREGRAGIANVYQEGLVAGVVGALVIAVWFLIVDSINGRPLYTPNVLGTALFRHGQGLDSPHTLPVSFDMVLVFTWVHFLVFGVIGGIAARLVAAAERQPNLGFGVVLLVVVFEFGFILAAMALAQPVLHALGWSNILIGNLLAAACMTLYFRQRHPQLRIEP